MLAAIGMWKFCMCSGVKMLSGIMWIMGLGRQMCSPILRLYAISRPCWNSFRKLIWWIIMESIFRNRVRKSSMSWKVYWWASSCMRNRIRKFLSRQLNVWNQLRTYSIFLLKSPTRHQNTTSYVMAENMHIYTTMIKATLSICRHRHFLKEGEIHFLNNYRTFHQKVWKCILCSARSLRLHHWSG